MCTLHVFTPACCHPSLVQLPDLSSLGWLSAVGALMSTLHMFTPACCRPSSFVQLPDLSSLGWLSAVGALMSVTYSVGGSALSLNSALPRDQV